MNEIGAFQHDICGFRWDMQKNLYDTFFQNLPEELLRCRLSPPSHVDGGATFSLGEAEVLESGKPAPNVIPGFEQAQDQEFDLFALANTEWASLEMTLPLYKALKNCGFKIIATKGFTSTGELHAESMRRRTFLPECNYDELLAFCDERRNEIIDILMGHVKLRAISCLIANFANNYGRFNPQDKQPPNFSVNTGYNWKTHSSFTRKRVCEFYKSCQYDPETPIVGVWISDFPLTLPPEKRQRID